MSKGKLDRLRAQHRKTNALLRKHKQRVAGENDSLASYIGGQTEFGRYVLKYISRMSLDTIRTATNSHIWHFYVKAREMGLLIEQGNGFIELAEVLNYDESKLPGSAAQASAEPTRPET